MSNIDQQLIAEAYSQGKVYYGEVVERNLRMGAVMIKLIPFPYLKSSKAIDVEVVDAKVSPVGRPFILLKLKTVPATLGHDDIIRFQRPGKY